MINYRVRLGIFTLLVFWGVFLGGGALQAQQNMGIMPTTPGDYWFIYEADPGDVIEGTAKVSNNANNAQTVEFSAVDAEATKEGFFALTFPVDPQYAIGVWTTVDENIITVESQSTYLVPFRIEIPETATPGEYAGGLLLLPYTAPDESQEGGGGGIRSFASVGARIYLTILGDPVFDFTWTRFAHRMNQESQHFFDFTFENKGNLSVDVESVTTLTNATFPYEPIEIIQDLGSAFPGQNIQPTIHWENPFKFGGLVTATTTIHYSGDFQDFYESGTEERSVTFWLPPDPEVIGYMKTALIAFIALVLLSIILIIRHRKLLKSLVSYTTLKETNLADIAKRYDVDWKLLAKINKIKAPYIVEKGHVIRIPKKQK